MEPHELAGKPPPQEILIDPARIEKAYYEPAPSAVSPVKFGTSGHRGSPLKGEFCEPHVLAIVQAVCDCRAEQGVRGPLFLGRDTHAASEPALRTAVEVLAANQVPVFLQERDRPTPTPAISRLILRYNRQAPPSPADGLVVTPSHNPPEDGGIKYNPPHGGPAETALTRRIEARANELLKEGNRNVRRVAYSEALRSGFVHMRDFTREYTADLRLAVDLEAVRSAGVRIGVDPLGGASLDYWFAAAEAYRLNLEVVNPRLDPRFAFVRVDHDGKIRMDCSSPWAMRGLVEMKDRFDIAVGCDPDADRHGVVCPSMGLLNPNFYLAAAIDYLLERRQGWPPDGAVGKTLVTSALIDRVAAAWDRRLYETPVGFKWFAEGLHSSRLVFAGEESAGASFLETAGAAWTTDKDGILLGLAAAELTARTGKDPGKRFLELADRHGRPYYTRVDLPIDAEQKERFTRIPPESLGLSTLGGEPVERLLDRAPGNDQPIGGFKAVTAGGWFAVRPSGTENILKFYAESLKDPEHLSVIMEEAKTTVLRALQA